MTSLGTASAEFFRHQVEENFYDHYTVHNWAKQDRWMIDVVEHDLKRTVAIYIWLVEIITCAINESSSLLPCAPIIIHTCRHSDATINSHTCIQVVIADSINSNDSNMYNY